MKNCNEIRMQADGVAEILIYDEIGESWFSEGVTAKGFAQQLKELGDLKQIDIRFNSPGGSVFEGLAIYNTLKEHKAKKIGYIDGLAASIATVVACACDTVHMADNAMFMIHNPWSMAVGTSEEFRKQADILDKLTENAKNIYVARTGRDETEIATAMRNETWYTAAEAKEAGFVDVITPNKQIAASIGKADFKNIPEWARARLSAIPATNMKGAEMADESTKPADDEEQKKKEEEMKAQAEADKKKEEEAAAKQSIDASAIAAKAAADERERITKIHSLCVMAKMPEKALAYASDPSISVADVQAKLFDALCKQNGPLGDEINAKETEKVDENKRFRDEYKAEPAYAKSMTEDQYVAMRRVETGMDSLKFAKQS